MEENKENPVAVSSWGLGPETIPHFKPLVGSFARQEVGAINSVERNPRWKSTVNAAYPQKWWVGLSIRCVSTVSEHQAENLARTHPGTQKATPQFLSHKPCPNCPSLNAAANYHSKLSPDKEVADTAPSEMADSLVTKSDQAKVTATKLV